MLTIKVRGQAAAQAVFDSVPGRRMWQEPKADEVFHTITCASLRESDALDLLQGLRVRAILEET